MINFSAAIPFLLIWMVQKCPKEPFLILHFVQFSGRVILDSAEVLNQSGATRKNHTSRISSAISSDIYCNFHSFASVFCPCKLLRRINVCDYQCTAVLFRNVIFTECECQCEC